MRALTVGEAFAHRARGTRWHAGRWRSRATRAAIAAAAAIVLHASCSRRAAVAAAACWRHMSLCQSAAQQHLREPPCPEWLVWSHRRRCRRGRSAALPLASVGRAPSPHTTEYVPLRRTAAAAPSESRRSASCGRACARGGRAGSMPRVVRGPCVHPCGLTTEGCGGAACASPWTSISAAGRASAAAHSRALPPAQRRLVARHA
jgi:hypothetical protein